MRSYFGRLWRSLTIKKKITTFTAMVFMVCITSLIFDAWIVKYSVVDFNQILEDNSVCINYAQAMETESYLFQNHVQNPEEVSRETLEKAMQETKAAVNALPYDYETIGEQRYSQTWSIRNTYEVYVERRTAFLEKGIDNKSYINDLYELYDMQEYLIRYGDNLTTLTMEDGNEVYGEMLPVLLSMPWLLFIFGCLVVYVLVKLSGVMYRTIVNPVMKLVDASKKIAGNDFFVEDVKVENDDELGELVKAFNKMKFATGEYITALEEKRETLDLLHEEELENLEMEKQLEAMKLELLKSQVNPHFLFNTLNVISGMANLEDAETTETMIKALSSLFRYNLKTSDFEVSLARELKVVEDYMYLQQMRFGDRISYDISCNADEELCIVPAFTFQPLVENCILHGLAGKEEGGKIRIRIYEEKKNLVICIGDNGVGMKPEDLEDLREKLTQQKNPEENRVGIGVGNIYRRIYSMYPGGSMEIYSKYNAGTVVKVVIPQQR